jgi:hypothetical protein
MKLSPCLSWLLATSLVAVSSSSCISEEVNVGTDPRDNAQADVKIDLYQCSKKNKNLPLVVFACGGGVPKEAYATFAEGLSSQGYVVAVIDHPVQFGPFAPPLNFGNAVDVENMIAYAEDQLSQGLLNVDMSTIVLMGHSFGSGVVLSALNEECVFPLYQDPNVQFPSGVAVPCHPGIVLASAYGASLNDQGGFSALQNIDDIPYGIINGAGDINFFSDLAGENLTQGSFDRLLPTKIIAAIENLDHFSISEVITNGNRGDVLLTLPREQQIDTVVDAMSYFLKKHLKKNPTNNFCNQIDERASEQGYAMIDCLEEYL